MRLIREAFYSARAQPVSSVITILIVGGACAAILATTGQTIRAEQQVLAQIDTAGTRSIVISDVGAADMHISSVDRIARTSGVEWVVGLGPATDANGVANPAGPAVAIRAIHGDIDQVVALNGPPTRPGVAYAGPEAQAALGFLVPVGGVVDGAGREHAVIGGLTASGPLDLLNRSLIAIPTDADSVVRSIHILATAPEQVASVAIAATMLISTEDPASIRVETSAALAEVRAAVAGELGRYGRQLIILVLGAGLVLTALNIYGSVTSRKRDMGRRRALGASRPAIMTLILLQTTIASLAGAALGAAAVSVVLVANTGARPDLEFTAAIIVLATFASGFASIPPAVVAAYRDPVRVLRVP